MQYYLIRKATLTAIADAVRSVKGITGKIPVSELDEVLSGVSPSTAGSGATDDLYLIRRQTLVDLANVIRVKEGTSGEIPVAKLSERILALKTDTLTPAILGRAVLGRTILGKIDVGGKGKLSTPSIELKVIEAGKKLGTPRIELKVIEEGDEPDIPDTPKLATPRIDLVVVEGGEEEPELPPILKLAKPEIYIETENEPEEPEEPEEPVIPKLEKPDIYIETVEDEPTEPEEPEYTEVPVLSVDPETGYLTWTAVEGAIEYSVDVTDFNIGGGFYGVICEDTKLDLAGVLDELARLSNGSFWVETGYYPVRVQAVFEDESRGEWSNTVDFYYENNVVIVKKLGTPSITLEEIIPGKLSAPTICITLDAPVLDVSLDHDFDTGNFEPTWNEVEGADEYVLDISSIGAVGEIQPMLAVSAANYPNGYPLSAYLTLAGALTPDVAVEPGWYKIRVKAAFKDKPSYYVDSEWSNTDTFIYNPETASTMSLRGSREIVPSEKELTVYLYNGDTVRVTIKNTQS